MLYAFISSHWPNRAKHVCVRMCVFNLSALLHTSVSSRMWETELEVQIILSACPCPCSPVLIPLSSLRSDSFPLLLPFLPLPPSNFLLHSVLDRFCLYLKHHLICLGKHIVHNRRALIDLSNVITPFSNIS